jgi:large repetitive protein
VNDQWPTNGYNVPSLTPELIASGSDSDGDTLSYDFTVYNADGSTLADSGWVSGNDWDVPSGKLAWDQT